MKGKRLSFRVRKSFGRIGWGVRERSGAQSTEIIMRSPQRGGERVELVINEANRKADLVGRLQASAVL